MTTPVVASAESRYETCAANVQLDEVTAWLEEAGAPYADKLWALMCAESTGKLDAVREDTNVYGAWQMSGATLRRYGCSPLNSTLEEQTICAAQYLRHLRDDMRMLSFEELIHAWALGGHNFERRGRTGTKMSKNLVWTVKRMLELDRERRGSAGE